MSNTFDLKHKIRKVSDLVRFIANTSVENVLENEKMKVGNPNFSILLGAGASISSGIQSGGQLVKKWKEDVYADKITVEYIDFVKEPIEEKETKDPIWNVDYF